MHRLARILVLAAVLPLGACNDASTSTPDAAAASTPPAGAPTAAAPPAERAGPNVLRMRIDGVEWAADGEIFGAVHPPGYDRAVLISGSHGPNDASEQDFSIILNGIDAPGSFHAKKGDARGNVAQLANLTPARYLAGGLMLEHDMTIEILRMQASPVLIEARFSGTLTANDDAVLRIEDGEFRYRE